MKCRNCGATLDEGALFCRKCGTSVPREPEGKTTRTHTERKTGLSGFLRRIPEVLKGIGGFFSDAAAWVRDRFNAVKDSKFFKNRRLLMMTGIGAALLVILIIVIASAASCKKPDRYKTPEELSTAVLDALDTGDGGKLYEMSRLSETVLGAHPETFGEGDTPAAVMQGYYERLAGDLRTTLSERYGEEYRLAGQLETTIVSDTSIFEANRALDLSAEQYAEISGPLTVNGEFVKNIRIVAVELDGEWKLLVVYLY